MNHTKKASFRHAGGFTLVELLVVITVIGILASFILAGLFIAKKRAQRAASQIKCNSLAQGVQDMLGKRHWTGSPMLEKADLPGIKDPFVRASKIEIDWELNPLHPKWQALMNPVNHDAPYFPRVNNHLRIGKDKTRIESYEFEIFCDFNEREIATYKGDHYPHALDPWKENKYLYYCYYVQSDAGRYLVDGILSFGPDGKWTDPVSGAVQDQVWSPNNPDDALNSDNQWKEIGRYSRK